MNEKGGKGKIGEEGKGDEFEVCVKRSEREREWK